MSTLDRLTAALADRYRIERELGAGGMATVYLAEDLKHRRKVAIKVLREDLAASLGAGRFLREIEIAAQLQHPNILPLLDSGDASGFLFYVMPYVTGPSLRERIAREGELPVHEAVRLIAEVVDALAHAHDHGVVHRDIKPDNVMLSGRHALVADFGVAKAVSEATGRSTVTTTGVAVGTPTYMSPEQAAADPHIDHRSDIYAVGVMTYELLTGQPPFVGATPQSVLAAHVTQAPDPVSNRRPGIPALLDAVIMRCLAKRPADRFQTAGELLAALEPFGTPSSGITPTQTRPITAVKPRRPLPMIAAAAVLLLVAAAGYWRFGRGDGVSTSTQAIAVLPFDNVARDTAFDYLADGVANDVRSALMHLPGLIVKARTSSEAARGKPVHDAGTMLKVGVILQGTYRRAGEQTNVTVDLVNVADEAALWTGNFTLPADGNFAAAQDSITAAVRNALHLAAAGGGSASQQRGTNDMAAYDDYLKGQFLFAKRGGDNLLRAVAYFKRAIARDAKFARAYAGLAMVYGILPGYTQVGSTDSVAREAERFARQALAIDATVVDGRLALANALAAQAQPAEAEQEFRKALILDPRNATAHQWIGAVLNVLGRHDEAIREGRAAVDLDPLSAVARNDLAYSLVSAGRYDEALTETRRLRELDARFAFVDFYAGLAFAMGQQTDSATAAFDRFFKLDSMAPEARAMQVWRFALAADWPAAERELNALTRTIVGGSRDIDIAIASVALGDRESALAALEREGARRSYYLATLAVGCDPTFIPLRSEPRFLAVVKAAGQQTCTGPTKWPIPARPGRKP